MKKFILIFFCFFLQTSEIYANVGQLTADIIIEKCRDQAAAEWDSGVANRMFKGDEIQYTCLMEAIHEHSKALFPLDESQQSVIPTGDGFQGWETQNTHEAFMNAVEVAAENNRQALMILGTQNKNCPCGGLAVSSANSQASEFLKAILIKLFKEQE